MGNQSPVREPAHNGSIVKLLDEGNRGMVIDGGEKAGASLGAALTRTTVYPTVAYIDARHLNLERI
jgi:hypothetical protein